MSQNNTVEHDSTPTVTGVKQGSTSNTTRSLDTTGEVRGIINSFIIANTALTTGKDVLGKTLTVEALKLLHDHEQDTTQDT